MSAVMSMTGFAAVSGALPMGRSFHLAVKSVNHRHLDLSVRLAMGMDALEPALRQCIKAHVRRGHLELTLTLEKASSNARVELDEALLDAYVSAFRQASEHYETSQEPDFNALLRLTGVMSATMMQVDASAAEAPILLAMNDLLARFNQARSLEGEALASDLRAGMAALLRLTTEARSLREGASEAEFSRLKARMQELLAGAEGSADVSPEVSHARLLTEAALLVARGDIDEELVRLRTHLERFLQILEAGGEVGRQLDFLLQEINREANTLLSKTSGGGVGLRLTEIGLEMKVGLERAREQVQNLE